ncbi:hypothetical protein MtrunA17_Chr2g0290851 [Medicago truncatula]|uniref:Uncharacterized protein n=1 Tax=Medicago truncatula TaxID=3880 RepID=A0A396J5Z2_MEDTR|nr:hypothetical protein MtrunA17_Chr2g0290851 [Medicago truncatula]
MLGPCLIEMEWEDKCALMQSIGGWLVISEGKLNGDFERVQILQILSIIK